MRQHSIALKRRFSQKYFRIIRRWNVAAILVANFPRRGRKNYIGPNTFAQVMIAVDARKLVFLLHGFHPPLRDELAAWGAIPLKGDIGALAGAIRSS